VSQPVGRPPIGARAMTAAEKQRRYRERKFGNKPPVTKPSAADGARVSVLEAEAAALRDQIITLKMELEAWTNVVKARTGAMTRATFNLVLSCLHADSRQSASDDKLHRAFLAFNRLRYVLCNEAEMPTGNHRLTVEELNARRRMTEAQRAEARAARRRRPRRSPTAPRQLR
jgi:hypothetical protein